MNKAFTGWQKFVVNNKWCNTVPKGVKHPIFSEMALEALHIVWDNSTICGQMKIEREGVSWNQAAELRSLWCNFSAFIIHDRSGIFSELRFILGRVACLMIFRLYPRLAMVCGNCS